MIQYTQGRKGNSEWTYNSLFIMQMIAASLFFPFQLNLKDKVKYLWEVFNAWIELKIKQHT